MRRIERYDIEGQAISLIIDERATGYRVSILTGVLASEAFRYSLLAAAIAWCRDTMHDIVCAAHAEADGAHVVMEVHGDKRELLKRIDGTERSLSLIEQLKREARHRANERALASMQ